MALVLLWAVSKAGMAEAACPLERFLMWVRHTSSCGWLQSQSWVCTTVFREIKSHVHCFFSLRRLYIPWWLKDFKSWSCGLSLLFPLAEFSSALHSPDPGWGIAGNMTKALLLSTGRVWGQDSKQRVLPYPETLSGRTLALVLSLDRTSCCMSQYSMWIWAVWSFLTNFYLSLRLKLINLLWRHSFVPVKQKGRRQRVEALCSVCRLN
jgi:hypothetical protein